MIPKIIHYCWFGRNPKPKLALKCIASWKKYCPDYEIIEWNEDNFDISACPLYVRQAYEAKKWAFVTDYVRLNVVYDHGGLYFDTDVELIRHPDELLEHSAYFGFEGGPFVNTGLGFGAEKNAEILRELMADYEGIPFVLQNGEYDVTSCTERNAGVFKRYGLICNRETQMLEGNIQILAPEWLCPYDDWSGEKRITQNTVSIHWYSASWQTQEYVQRKREAVKANTKARYKKNMRKALYSIRYFPNRVLMILLGEQKYTSLKKKIKGKTK
ncbi:MAG: glycosyl transferase [Clostridia bacterium]|nr:glycosyl transferase [Clostridia bacterium]